MSRYRNTRTILSQKPALRQSQGTRRARSPGRYLVLDHQNANHIFSDIEKGLKPINDVPQSLPVSSTILNGKEDVADGNSVLTWCFLLLLLIGILASIIGYVGCFTVVQNIKSSTGPLSWLCSEAGLSLICMFIWSLNPTSDEAPPLELTLTLDEDAPLPTCEKSDQQIQEEKVLPLARSDQFLEAISSFAGLVEHFDNPGFTLYYTLTRREVVVEPIWFLSNQVLYITIFDYKEQTT